MHNLGDVFWGLARLIAEVFSFTTGKKYHRSLSVIVGLVGSALTFLIGGGVYFIMKHFVK